MIWDANPASPYDKKGDYSFIAEPFSAGFIGALNDAIFISQSTIGAGVGWPFFRQGLGLRLFRVIIRLASWSLNVHLVSC